MMEPRSDIIWNVATAVPPRALLPMMSATAACCGELCHAGCRTGQEGAGEEEREPGHQSDRDRRQAGYGQSLQSGAGDVRSGPTAAHWESPRRRCRRRKWRVPLRPSPARDAILSDEQRHKRHPQAEYRPSGGEAG